ncbi:hypothetical protein BCIN_08g01370 [Botrytis cinerea B05.10]|uniref:SRP9 domain-containing protein n=3 Tax=Botryotinia fuckeliana TaxID=40559 RepID=A0A384JP85_BOTFB|nr:hypothetical protein BCIN_08g01370 [Botrytis cinerea B05.10]ATZ52399.1 hypothetical protein BCIN_08g01370 [Botrytis cinerea B05.10]EMR81507.1 putative wd repeat protein [Botrytis cinerea BcDW1]CCD43721.1 hypothetical protein BofuT4_P009690.1 [Botrytis cinerea T4]
MPHLDTAQEWLTQSSMLLKAHPSTTRITTKYTLLHAATSTHAPSTTHSTATKPRLPKPSSTPQAPTAVKPESQPRGTLTLTTFNPHSGVNLKYTTNKAAEVSRLIQIMGRLGKLMCGLPETEEKEGLGEINMAEAPVEEEVDEKKDVGKGQAQTQTQPQGGKGKKKKGKK